MILVQNKCDLVDELTQSGFDLEEYMKQESISKFATENGFLKAFCTSAKSGSNVDEAFEFLIKTI